MGKVLEERGHPARLGSGVSQRCLYCTQSHPPRQDPGSLRAIRQAER
jgi:hypothetical protein